MVVLIIVVVFVVVWNFTPLPDWIADGQSWWQATSGWISTAWHWLSTIGKASGDGN